MSKRAPNKFERNENDLYATTQVSAVRCLGMHIPSGIRYIEPCAGDGSLVRLLDQELGTICVKAIDISPGSDFVEKGNAFYLKRKDLEDASLIITNPPYERTQMHGLIDHCRRLLPSWFLLEADWLQTVQAAPLLYYADSIVSIGRIKWIVGSKATGYDNYCWVRFHTRLQTRGVPFFPRRKDE